MDSRRFGGASRVDSRRFGGASRVDSRRFGGASRVETVTASGFHGSITGTSSHSDMICNCDKIKVISIVIRLNSIDIIINLYFNIPLKALKVKARSESFLAVSYGYIIIIADNYLQQSQ